MASKNNSFKEASTVIGAGIDTLFNAEGPQFTNVYLDMIVIKKQIRDVFEDDENTLADLAEDIKVRGVLQPIVLCETDDGYVLVAGERRYRASVLAGLDQIPAMIHKMTPEEAREAQIAENIHRLNLKQIEEARTLQEDLDKLGSVSAVCEKYKKNKVWLSKRLSLLTLPEQAKRLVMEDISADIEVLNTVKTIEKADPEAAKALVDGLKDTLGTGNVRDKVAAVKAQVKPSKAQILKQEEDKQEQELDDSGFTPEETTNVVPIFAPAKHVQPDNGQVDDANASIGNESIEVVSQPRTETDLDRAKVLGSRIADCIQSEFSEPQDDTSPLHINLLFNRQLRSYLASNKVALQTLMTRLEEEVGFWLEMEVPIDLFDTDIQHQANTDQVDWTEHR